MLKHAKPWGDQRGIVKRGQQMNTRVKLVESEVEKRGNKGKEEGKKRGFGKAMDVNTIMQLLLWIVNCKCFSDTDFRNPF